MIQTFAAAFALSVCLIGVFKPMAVHAGLVDSPSVRKRHDGNIPLIGGLALYVTLLLLVMIFPNLRAQNGLWLIGLGLPLLLVGMVDDRWQISAHKRLLSEICCSYVAVSYCGIRLDDIGHLLPNVGGSLVLLAIPLSVLGMVGVINAFNMVDGVDGLAGGLACLTFAALAVLALQSHSPVALQLVAMVANLVGFLVFNSRFFGRARASIFLGDGGAMFIGFALGWYLISLSQGTAALITPVSALWLLAVPLLDTMTIMLRRMRRGHSPFAADREHLHHILLMAGFGANRTVLIILGFHLMCILYALASIQFHIAEWISFALALGLFALYYAGMNHAWKMMKRIKHFREWAGFEDRRSESRGSLGRRSGSERRCAQMDLLLAAERRAGKDRRNGQR